MNRRHFAGVEEWNTQEAECVDEVVHIQEEDRRIERGLVVRHGAKTREANLAHGHAGCGGKHEKAAAVAVNGEGSDDGTENDDELGGGGKDVGFGQWEA